MNNFSHWNEAGRPKMVDISEKEITTRTAIARSTITLSNEVYQAIQQGGIKKGDPTQVAQIAGIMGAKKQLISSLCATLLCYRAQICNLTMRKSIMVMRYTFKLLSNAMEKRVSKWRPLQLSPLLPSPFTTCVRRLIKRWSLKKPIL